MANLPVIRSFKDHLYQEVEDNTTDDNNNTNQMTKNDHHSSDKVVKQLFTHLNHGATIERINDNETNITQHHLFTRTVLLKHPGGSLSQHEVIKFQPGPLQSYYDSENNNTNNNDDSYPNSKIVGNVLTADSQLVYIEQSFESISNNNNNTNNNNTNNNNTNNNNNNRNENEDARIENVGEEPHEEEEVSGVLKLQIFFLDFTHNTWQTSTHRVPVWDNFGTHTFTLHQSQLLLTFNRPLKSIAFDVSNLLSLRHDHVNIRDDVIVKYEWRSEAIVTRILSCLNFVLLFTNQKEFLALTLHKSQVIESKIRKPCTSLKEEYDELVQLVNVGGRVVLVAQKDSKLLFLRIQNNDIFVPIQSVDLSQLNYFQSSYPLIIKNIMSWRRSRLFIPVAVMGKSFPEDDQDISDSAAVIEVDLVSDFSVVSILQIDSHVDIYQDTFHLTLMQHGTTLLTSKERKSADRKKARVISNHVTRLLPSNLKQACLSALTNDDYGEDESFSLSSKVKTYSSSKHFERLIAESYDF